MVENGSGGVVINDLELAGDLLYAGGHLESAQGMAREGGAAYDLLTDTLSPWNPQISEIDSLSLANGVMYVGGQFSILSIEPPLLRRAAAVDAQTGELLFDDWDPNPNGPVRTAITHGGYVYLGGDFTDVADGSGHGYIAAVRRLDLAPLDLDADGDVDMDDMQPFVDCLRGPSVPAVAGCRCADLDEDGDTDAADFAVFQRLFAP